MMTQEEILVRDRDVAKRLIESKGGVLLDISRIRRYGQNMTTCKVECKNHHIWNTILDRLKQDNWCMKCANEEQRVGTEEVRKLIESKQGLLLKDEIVNGVRFITIRCLIDGHEWRARLNDTKCKGIWCNECFKRRHIKKVERSEVEKTLRDKDFILLTTGHIDFWSKIDIRCSKHNHEWTTKYGHFERGNSNCVYCGHNAPSFDDMVKVIESKNAVFVERLHKVDTAANIILRCLIHNHEWTTNSADIMRGDDWCYYCGVEAMRTPYETIKQAVESRGGILLTVSCSGSWTKVMVKCEKGHDFETTFDRINAGRWCPKCRFGKKQAQCQHLIEDFLNEAALTEYNKFWWQVTDKGRKMKFDAYFPTLGLVGEYDGEQHFWSIRFKGESEEAAQEAFVRTQQLDALKNQRVAEHPEDVAYFIRFRYDAPITKEYVLYRLVDVGIPLFYLINGMNTYI